MNKTDLPIISSWGLSTWINLYDCDKKIITSKEAIYQYVIELCDMLEVNRFGEPTIIDFGREERVKGFSMTQLIETSLVSAHFVNLTRTVYIDIFSCKWYDAEKAFAYSKEFFKAQHGVFETIERK